MAKKLISVRLDASTLKFVDDMAKETNNTRTYIIESLIALANKKKKGDSLAQK